MNFRRPLIRNIFSTNTINDKGLFHHIELLIVAAFLCTSFINAEFLIDGIINSKSIYFLFITSLALLIEGIGFILVKPTIKLNLQDSFVGSFLLYSIFNNSLKGSFLLSTINLETAGLLVLYLFSKKVFRGKKDLPNQFVVMLFMLASGQIVTAILQWYQVIPSYNSSFRFTGFFFNPDPFAIYLSILLLGCLIISLYHTKKNFKIGGLLLFFLGLPIILISTCRSAWFAMAFAISLIFAFKFRASEIFSRHPLKTKFISYLVIVATLVCAYSIYRFKKDSADGRILIYKLSTEMISDHPIQGIGGGNFKVAFLNYQSKYFKNHPQRIRTEGRLADQVWYAFDDFLQIFVEQGFVGLMFFTSFCFVAVQSGFRLIKRAHNPEVPIFLTVTIIGILASGIFSYPLVMLPIQIMFYGFLGMLSGYNTSQESCNEHTIHFQLGKLNKTMVSAICFVVGFIYIKNAVNNYHAYNFKYSLHTIKSVDDAMQHCKKYQNVLRDESWCVLIECNYLINHERYIEAIKKLEISRNVTPDTRIIYALTDLYSYNKMDNLAEKEYKFLYYGLPDLVRPKYLLAKFYYQTNQTAKWKIASKEVMNFQPKINNAFTKSMKNEIKILMMNNNLKHQ